MNKIKEIVLKYKKVFLISFGLIILLVSLYFLYNSFFHLNTYQYNLILYGEDEISIYKGDEYIEPGFIADYKNNIVTDEVIILGEVNTDLIGTYVLTYKIGDINKTRIVNVIENPNALSLELIGSDTIILNQGEKYEELGYKALFYEEDISNNVLVTGEVDINTPGIYYLNYEVSYSGQVEKLQRKIVVLESLKINFEYSKELTNKNLNINIKVTGNNFSYIKLPDGVVNKEANITYSVSKNGIYNFLAYDSDGNYKEASVNINNIDKILPKATCTAKSYSNRTEISINASDNLGIDRYIYNKTYVSKQENYTINSKLDSVSVSVYDLAGNSVDIDCSLTQSMIEMHFIAGVSDDDAILIRTEDKTIMIDGGQWKARDKVISYLKDLGVKKIDALIGSHVHWNHVQTHAAILDNFEVDNVYYSVDILNCVSLGHCVSNDVLYTKDKIKEKKITPIVLKTKSYLQIGDMKLYFIGPIRGKLTTYQNANSLVFILKYGNNKFMFTGDTPDNYMDTDKFLAEASYFNMNLDIDVLKMPHHGYEDLTDKFFKATTPKYAILPNCCSCSSKYPSSTNKKLMKSYNTTYYQVCDSKNIVLTADGNNIVIKTNQKAIDWKR